MKRLIDWRISDTQLRQYWVYLCVQHQYEEWWRNLSYEQQLDIAYDRWQKEYNFALTALEHTQKQKILPNRQKSTNNSLIPIFIVIMIFIIWAMVKIL